MVRLRQSWSESILKRSCCPKKIVFWYDALLHDFHIRQLSDYFITQFIEGRGHKGITIIKIFEFENTKRNIKKCCSHREKGKQHVRLIIYTQTRGIFLLRLPCYWLYRWTNHSMWCSSCRIYFYEWLQINDKSDK